MTKKKPNPFVQSILNTSVDSAQNVGFHTFHLIALDDLFRSILVQDRWRFSSVQDVEVLKILDEEIKMLGFTRMLSAEGQNGEFFRIEAKKGYAYFNFSLRRIASKQHLFDLDFTLTLNTKNITDNVYEQYRSLYYYFLIYLSVRFSELYSILTLSSPTYVVKNLSKQKWEHTLKIKGVYYIPQNLLSKV